MPGIQAKTNPEHTKPWLVPLGKLVLNFSAVELQSHLWLADIAPRDEISDQDLYAGFSERVRKFRKRIHESSIPATLKSDFDQAWDEALGVARRRNSILHNPVMFGWLGPSEVGPPDVMHIADVAHLGSRPPKTERQIKLSDLNELVDETAHLGLKIISLRLKLQEALA